MKNFLFNKKMTDLKSEEFMEDNFIYEIMNFIEKNKFDEETLIKLSMIHKNRYELTFFKICFYFKELKSSKRDSKLRNNIPHIKEKIIKEIKNSNEKLKKKEYLLENMNNNDLFIFKPFNLLKLW